MTQYEEPSKTEAERLARGIAWARMSDDKALERAYRNRAARLGIDLPDEEPNEARTSKDTTNG